MGNYEHNTITYIYYEYGIIIIISVGSFMLLLYLKVSVFCNQRKSVEDILTKTYEDIALTNVAATRLTPLKSGRNLPK